MNKKVFRLIFWGLALALLSACAGTAGPVPADLGSTQPPGLDGSANAAQPLAVGQPAPIADTVGCEACVSLFLAKPKAECRFEDQSYRMHLSGHLQPSAFHPRQNLSGLFLRIVDPSRSQYLDTPLSGEIRSEAGKSVENLSGSFETKIRSAYPPDLKYYLLPTGATPPVSNSLQACSGNPCAPPGSLDLNGTLFGNPGPLNLPTQDPSGENAPAKHDLKPAPSDAILMSLVPNCELDLKPDFLR